jgi:hypothetical protein
MAERLGVFAVDMRFGIIKPSSALSLCFSFTPAVECNSWKRLGILLANADPLNIDLLGTGYTSIARPPTLHIQHIKAFLCRLSEGGPLLPPEQSLGSNACEGHSAPKTLTIPDAEGYQSWDVLFQAQDLTKGIVIEPLALTFNPTSVSQAGEAQRLTVTNELPFPVIASITVPLWTDPEGTIKSTCAWHVTPAVLEISPSLSVEFQVVFQPPADARYFSQSVDVVACAKHMSSFRLCEEVCMHVTTMKLCASFDDHIPSHCRKARQFLGR